MKSVVYIVLGIIIIAGAAFAYQAYYLPTQPGYDADGNRIAVTNYDECVEAGYAVMESDPEQCSDGEQTFVNTTEDTDDEPMDDESESQNEVPDTQAQITAAQSLDLVGMSQDDAAQVAAENGILFRIVERDGESLAVTMDYRPGRINATVEAGVVTDYTIEGADNQ